MRRSSASSPCAREHAAPSWRLPLTLVAALAAAGFGTVARATPPSQSGGDGVGAAAEHAIRSRLEALVEHFDHELPQKKEIIQLFSADGFYHNGLGLDAYLDQVLLKPRANPEGFDYVGVDVEDLQVDEVLDADHVYVTYTVSVKHRATDPGPGHSHPGRQVAFRPWPERMLMTRAHGRWLLAGNQNIAGAGVNFLARLAEKAQTQAQLDARADVFTSLATWDPLQRMAYLMRVTPEITGWIGFPGDSTFGVVAWVGDNMDYWWTPSVNERELRRQYNQYLASPSSRIRAYMVFNVSSTEIDPRVASVHVTGPGLPPAGLNLVRPPPQYPRPNLIFRGDQFHWNAFSTERCSTMAKVVDDPADPRDYIPDCALDWSHIGSGSNYLYAFLDADGNLLGQLTRQLKGDVLGEDGWYAARDTYVGQFTLDAPDQFTIANVLDTSATSPFIPGGAVDLKWRMPTGDGVRLEGLSYWRAYYLNNDYFNPSSERQEEHWYQLYGSDPVSWLGSSELNDWMTTWAWSTLIFRDKFGNQFDHEVSPANPY
jgi:hypothetical protein